MNKNLKTGLIVGGSVILILIALPLLGGSHGWWCEDGDITRQGMMGGFGGWGMAIGMVLIPILAIWAVVALVRGFAWSGARGHGQTESALEMLRRRYARGDISREEFEEKKKELE